MKNFILWFHGITLGLLAVGCSPIYYMPNSHNVPLITEKGEGNLNVSVYNRRVEVQTSFGVDSNFSVVMNIGYFFDLQESSDRGGSGMLSDFGVGYNTTFRDNGVFELYGLLGIGNVENHWSEYNLITSNITRLGIQPNIGYKSDIFSAAFSMRFMNLRYHNIQGDLDIGSENQIAYLMDNSSNILIEPAVTMRVGWKKLKFQFQGGLSYNASNEDFLQENAHVTMGLNYKF